jgi:uncharacterized repeat protein (TIGR03803 family)
MNVNSKGKMMLSSNQSRNSAVQARADCRLFLVLAALWVVAWMPEPLRAQGIEQRLYSFGLPGAANPNAALIQGSDGVLYGTTIYGGTNGDGTVFRIGTNGSSYTVLHSFTGRAGDGANPIGSLVQGADGALYGTTFDGGNHYEGTVFRLIPWPVGAGSLQISRSAGQGAQLSFVPPVDAASAISVSSDLVSWTLLTNLPASLGPVYFTDETSTNFTQRFYRASWTP